MKFKVLVCIYAALIFAAYMQPLNHQLVAPNNETQLPLFVLVMYLSAWLTPMLPALIACFALLGMKRFPRLVANLLAVISIMAGLILTLASSVFSLFSNTQVLHGVTLTIAVATSFLIWSSTGDREFPSRWVKIGLSVSTAAALWSVLTVPMILFQARWIADGSPYCIAHHGRGSEISGFSDLRGFSFYTEKTGYKSTSEWFFHGLMIVNFPDGEAVYNWSPRGWRFDQIADPGVFIEPVGNACVP
ncbi:hypothetical protein, partial [Roseibium sp. RKSG952]|uniref:hypothetical protein n=1 Tax=Roseibium sp. RKSG952 TaxID=2529384 RepID=UPI0018AD1348